MSPAAAVRWRPAANALAPWRQLLPAPASNGGFTEKGRYLFEKPGPGWALRIDDEPLADAPEARHWTWSPGFYAGEVKGELVSSTGSEVFALDVSPDPEKVGRDIFAAMVDELWEANPALVVGDEPATRQIGDLGSRENPWLEFARYRRYLPEFLRATAAIRARPRRTLRVERTSVALHRARRVDRQTAFALSRSRAAVFLLPDGEAHEAVPPDARLDVPVVEETLDSAANRAVLALALALLRRGRALQARLSELVDRERESETETPLASRWPVRRQVLEDLAARVKATLRQSPFVDARRAEITAAGLTAVAADPTYSRAWNQGWRALRHGLEESPTSERLWISPSWEIYERWCFLRLGRLLGEKYPEWDWRRDDTARRWTGSHGTKVASLDYQAQFRSMAGGAVGRSGRWSVSRQREPDLTLTVQASDGSDRRFVVFDAKYRVTRGNLLDAMESAHIYQDSLRVEARRPESSLLLVPAGGGADWLEEPAYQAEHRVGIIPFAFGGPTSLPSVVHALLGS
jgi:hypothetical protein